MAVENKNALPNGTILKHGGTEYRIERFLGSGGFGITYLVLGVKKKSGQTFSQQYAIKEHFMSQDCERDYESHSVLCSKPAKERVDEGRKDFLAEANRLKEDITHSHIVSVKDVFEANKTAYYVMEFLDGKSLRSYIRKNGACKEDEAVLLLLPIARAVGYLHDQRITHLDIKPDNIMIVETDTGKLCPILIDFGLSKHYDKKGKPTSSIRVQATSDGYSPMEQYLGISDFQPTADIYALAATMVYCLTAKDPKRAADIRPGEMRTMLEGKVSDSRLSALLKALTPSKYERTESIRAFLTELCPYEDLNSWDTETDNNITNPIFFRKKKKGSFLSVLRNIFGGKNSKSPSPKLLLPDNCMIVEIRQPKEFGLSKKVWFCKGICNTVYSFYRNVQIDDEDFAGGFNSNVLDILNKYNLLSPCHWEDDFVPPTSDGASCKYVSISFLYKDGTSFERSNTGVYGSSRLLEAAEAILNCVPIVFGKDEELLKNAEKIINERNARLIPTTSLEIDYAEEVDKPLSSFMIGVHNGVMTEIDIRDWKKLSNNEKAVFTPRFVYFKLEDFADGKVQTLGLAVEEQSLSVNADVEKSIAEYAETLNPSGISGYEHGNCHLPNVVEMRILEYYHDRINITLKEWNLQPFNEYFFIEDNGQIMPNSSDTLFMRDLKIGLRLVVDYWATRVCYKLADNNFGVYELNGIEVLTFDKIPDRPLEASLYHIPQIHESMFAANELESNLKSVVQQLKDMKSNHFPTDDETPIKHFWNHLKSSDSILLAGNAAQFIHAQLLHYKWGPVRILNPSVLNALWHIVSSHANELSLDNHNHVLDFSYDKFTCTCNIGDGVVEVEDIKFIEKSIYDTDAEGVIKGGILVNQILHRHLSDVLLLDMIEFDISLGIVSNGAMRDYRTIVKKSKIPLRKTEEIPFDIIHNAEIYLYIGEEIINIDLKTYFANVTCDIATLSVYVNADKSIWFSVGNNSNSISLGQILHDNNFSIH